jgi:3-oxoacyl-[acyl-carrier protein] reductase
MIESGRNRAGGTIVNIGWDQAQWGMAGDSGEMFAAVKGAVMSFTRSLAKSLAPQVRVNCIAPGWIQTKWGQHASDYWQQRAKGESLLERWGTPDDVAAVACFLVSPAARFITGQSWDVNGGRGPAEPHA